MIYKILIVASLIFISCKPAKKEPLVLLDCIPQNTVAAFQLKDQNMLKNTITNFPFLEDLGKINDSLTWILGPYYQINFLQMQYFF